MTSINVTTPSDHEIVMTRVFDAPRELVFAAHTEAAHLAKWWGRGNPLDVEIDLRPGGRWRYVETAPDGTRHGFRGEFHEIVAPERLVQTFEYEGMPGHILTETHVFTEQDGETLLTSTAVFASREDRDGMLQSGMEVGAAESYEALDRLLATLV